MTDILFEDGKLISRKNIFPSLPFSKREVGNLDWMDFGNCRGEDSSIFYPDRNMDSTEARKKFCSRCDVQQECFMYAVENDEQDGIWGGYGLKSRRRISKAIRLGKMDLDDL